jgi:hypothetical protein
VRVYLPSTLAVLADVLRLGEVGPAPLTGFAVTPGLREWYSSGDEEELEYAALVEAARASLRLLDAEPLAPRRRLVLAADVPDTQVQPRPDLDRAVVLVTVAVPLDRVASAHVDSVEAEPTVARAAAATLEAELGSEEAQFAVDEAEGFELAWFATQEIPGLLGP